MQKFSVDTEPTSGHIHSLPNEALAMILKKIKFEKRLTLRVLCTRIKEVIEGIGAGQKSLIITEYTCEHTLDFLERFSSMLTMEQDRYLTHSNWEENMFVSIAPKHFNPYFADLMNRLFPNVQQLFFSLYVTHIWFSNIFWKWQW